MDTREQRGQEIARSVTLKHNGDRWTVASQSGGDAYTVDLTGGIPRCTCPDHTLRRAKCKHIYAVEFSISRAVSATRACQEQGYIDRTPCYNSTFGYLENPSLTPILKALIEESASPLKAIESDSSVDASGLTTCRFVCWYDAKYGKMHAEREWLKCHLMVGVKTNIVTSAEVAAGNANDSPELPALVAATAKRFTPKEVSADKGYISNKNLEAIAATGAVCSTSIASAAMSSWPTITGGRTWRRRSRWSRGSLAIRSAPRRSPPRSTRFCVSCWRIISTS